MTVTGRIYDSLVREFGDESVFKDTQDIPLGADWRGVLREEIHKADVVLVVIGSNWIDARSEDGKRRLDDPEDWVRFEAETALQSDRESVIPLLVNGMTKLPKPQLPTELQELHYKQWLIIREDPDFRSDMQQLIGQIRNKTKPAPRTNLRPSRWVGLVSVIGLLVLLAAVFSLYSLSDNVVSPTIESIITMSPVTPITVQPTNTTLPATATSAQVLVPTQNTPLPTMPPTVVVVQPETFVLTVDRNFSGLVLCVSDVSSVVDLSTLELSLPDAGGSGERYTLNALYSRIDISAVGTNTCLCVNRRDIAGFDQCTSANTSDATQSTGDWVNTPVVFVWQGQICQIPPACQNECPCVFEE